MSILRKYYFTIFVILKLCNFYFYVFRKCDMIIIEFMFFVITLSMKIGGCLWAMERN